MLILTRRIGEVVMIGDEVQVKILAVKGEQVRVGISAPQSVSIHREEVYDRIKSAQGACDQRPSQDDPGRCPGSEDEPVPPHALREHDVRRTASQHPGRNEATESAPDDRNSSRLIC